MLQVLVLMMFWNPLALCGDITLEESSTPAILGHPFKFSCRVSGVQESGLTLFRIQENVAYATVCKVDVRTGVQQVGNNGSYLCSRDDLLPHMYTLTIRKVSTRDRSKWMCQSSGMQSNTIDLDVLYPPSLDIHSVQPCTGYTFFLNQNASLNCSVTTANPSPSNFTWYHGEKVVGRDQMYTMPKVYKSSSGLYRCVADNGVFPPGEDSVTIEVHSPPVVNIDQTQSVVNVSGDITIHCKADAYPEVMSVVWTKQDVGGQISDNGTLHLKNIQRDDAGVYVCTATNKVRSCSGAQLDKKSSAHFNLTVQYAPEIHTFNVTSAGGSVKEHDNVTLRCHTGSNPASVTEIRNRTSSLARGTSGQILEASIDDVGCLQTGPYACSARSDLGTAQQSISLQVKCAPRPYGSTTDGYEFRSVLSGNVTLQLTVLAFPEPTFTWSRARNGRPLSNSTVITDGAVVTGSITIFDVRKEDFRNYTVKVSNMEGSISKTIVLIYASTPDTPNDLQASSVSTHSVTLTWEKAFNGGAKQRFNIQYRQPGGQWTTHPRSLFEDETLQLDIDGLEPGTVYEIRINAQNEYGASNYTNTIVVETESVDYGLIAATATAVIVIIIVGIIITVVLVRRNRKRVQADDPPGNTEEEVEEIVMEDNLLYESSGDLQRPLVADGSKLYTEINTISKTNNAVEDVYAKPKKENSPDKVRIQNDTAADVYAKPLKKVKGKPDCHVDDKKADATPLNHDSDDVYVNTGAYEQ